ncbi:MAG: rfaEb [Cyanobacteria bacterium RYN_339]|nr:rfaEb [Cyanobacteria bacterium RYN_339]
MSKLQGREALAATLAALPGTTVFTNGVFDLMHVGHLRYLQAARALGDRLVVGVNADSSVKRLNKGPDRPILPEAERAELLAGLACVDFVTIFDEPTADAVLAALKPHVYCKGGDYTPDSLPEAPTVRAYGGRIEILAFVPGRSTTSLIARILATSPERTP